MIIICAIKGGWAKKVNDLVGKGQKNSVIKNIGNVDAAIKKFEKLLGSPLHLFWMFPATWDRKTAPLVAFVPLDKDPDDLQSIPAFDSQGNRFELDNKGALAKNRPVIVITINNRTQADGSLKKNMLTRSASNSKEARANLTVGAQLVRVDYIK